MIPPHTWTDDESLSVAGQEEKAAEEEQIEVGQLRWNPRRGGELYRQRRRVRGQISAVDRIMGRPVFIGLI